MNKKEKVMENIFLVRKYSNQKIEKPTILLQVTNPQAFIRAKEFEIDCRNNPGLEGKVMKHKHYIKKAISLI